MATNRVSPKKGKVVDIPDAVVTIGTPTAGAGQVSVAFTASSPATGGPVQKYTAVSNPGSVTVSGSTSPVVVTGLTNGTAYTFTVAAANATGNGVFSSASASATPDVQTSYESIATYTGNGSAFNFTLTSIPNTFKHLQVRVTALNTSGIGTVFMAPNSDSGNSYRSHTLYGTGSAAGAISDSNNSFPISGYGGGQLNSTYPTVAIIDILDYADTNKNKTIRTLSGFNSNNTGAYGDTVQIISGLWAQTTAISSLNFRNDFQTAFSTSTSFALYGIKG